MACIRGRSSSTVNVKFTPNSWNVNFPFFLWQQQVSLLSQEVWVITLTQKVVFDQYCPCEPLPPIRLCPGDIPKPWTSETHVVWCSLSYLVHPQMGEQSSRCPQFLLGSQGWADLVWLLSTVLKKDKKKKKSQSLLLALFSRGSVQLPALCSAPWHSFTNKSLAFLDSEQEVCFYFLSPCQVTWWEQWGREETFLL